MALTEKKTKSLDRLRECAARLRSEEGEGERNKIRTDLESATWEVFAEVVGAVVLDELRDDLPFTDRDRRALDYGFFELGIDQGEGTLRKAIDAARDESVPGIRFVTDSLRARYRTILKFDEGRGVFETEKSLNETIALAALRVASLRRTRDRLLEWTAPPEALAGLVRVHDEIDAELERYLRLRRRSESGQVAEPRERGEFAELGPKMESRLERRDRALTALPGGGKVTDVGRRVEAVLAQRFAAEEGLAQARAAIEVFEEAVRSSSPRQARADLVAEIENLRMFARMAAQRAGVPPQTTPATSSAAELATPRRVAEVLDRLLEFDPRLWDNPQALREGRPSVLLVPGRGHGLYDWSANRVILPTVPSRSLEESLAYALATYRDDVDCQTCDGAGLASYRALEPNAGIRSTMKLKELLARDYVAWMTQESRGQTALAPENKSWIEEHVAPRPDEPIPDRTLVDLPAADRRRLASRLANRGDLSAEEFYRRGVLRFGQADHAGAIEDFQRALAARPGWRSALYSLGVSLKRAGRPAWRETMAEFLRAGEQGWWSKAAERMLAR